MRNNTSAGRLHSGSLGGLGGASLVAVGNDDNGGESTRCRIEDEIVPNFLRHEPKRESSFFMITIGEVLDLLRIDMCDE